MKSDHTLKTVYSALFAALIFAGTQFIRIPLPFGYFHLGDCFILLSAMMIGGPYAVIASAIGAAMADVLSGYVIYAPATIIIKSLMVITMAILSRVCRNKDKKIKIALLTAGAAASELIMVCGYFVYDKILYGFAGAFVSLPGNILQAIAAVVTSVTVVTVLEDKNLLKNHT